MNAFRFLDIEFQKKAVEISKMRSDNYDVAVGGEAQALRMLLEGLRIFYKWVAVPKVIFRFLAVKLGLIQEPVSPLKDEMDSAIKREVSKKMETLNQQQAPQKIVPQGSVNEGPPTSPA